MPQTRFVLQKALEFGHKIIIAINKIDRPDARLNEIGDEVLELLLNLDATDEQLDSPIVYCSGRAGTASMSPNVEGKDLTPLFEQILEHIPAPHVDTEGPTQMLVCARGSARTAGSGPCPPRSGTWKQIGRAHV